MSENGDFFELASFLPYRFAVAAERLSAGLARHYRSEFGISVAEWRILAHAADAGAVSIREIHLRVSVEKSKASRAAARLVTAGYLMKDVNAQDRRLVALTLTPEGSNLMAKLATIADAYQARLLTMFGPHMASLSIVLDLITEEAS